MSALEIAAAVRSGERSAREVLDEHLAVVDALERKDDLQAQKEMARHLEQCACRMLNRGERRFDLRAALGKPGQT